MRFALFSATLLASGLVAAATPIEGWYSSAFGGYTYIPDNLKKHHYGRFFHHATYDDGFNAGGRFGFQDGPLRYEGEFTYLQARTRGYMVDKIQQRHTTGQTYIALGMANLYYDFPEMVPSIAPFLGIGIGYAWVDADFRSHSHHEYFRPTHFQGSGSVFAYQATAGLTYNFAENYAINLAYRYIGTDNVNHLGKVLQANLASAGVVYRFNENNYK